MMIPIICATRMSVVVEIHAGIDFLLDFNLGIGIITTLSTRKAKDL
jgi:hypothetical protein